MHIVRSYPNISSFRHFEEYIKELTRDGGHNVVRGLSLLYRLVHFKEERVLILKGLIDCHKEKTLLESLVELSHTDDIDELIIILKGFYRFCDNIFYPRLCSLIASAKNADVLVHCIRILGKLGRPDILPEFHALFDAESPAVCYELLHAMLLIGEPMNVRELEDRIIRHKRGNLFLKDKRILETFIITAAHLGGRERADVLAKYRFYPEKKIALLAGNFIALIELERSMFESERRKGKYLEEMFRLLTVGNAGADSEAVKAEPRDAETHEASEWDIASTVFCRKYRDRIQDELTAYLKAHVFHFEKYGTAVRFAVENCARLSIPYVNELLWQVYLSAENKYLLAAILDSIFVTDASFADNICVRLAEEMADTDAKMIYSRIPYTIIRLKKERAVADLIALASRELPPEKEEAVFRALADALVHKSYYGKLTPEDASRVNAVLDASVEARSPKVREIIAQTAAGLKLTSYTPYVIAEFRRDPMNIMLVTALMDMDDAAADAVLASLAADERYFGAEENYILTHVFQHFCGRKRVQPPIPAAAVAKLVTLAPLAPACITYAGVYGMTELVPLFRDMLGKGTYIADVRIIEALGMLHDTESLPIIARYLYRSDRLAIIAAAKAIDAMGTADGFTEILNFCLQTNISDELKLHVLADVTPVYTEALGAIGKIMEIAETAKHPELIDTLIDMRLRIDIEDRIHAMKRGHGL